MSGLRLRNGIFLGPFHANEEDPSLAFRRDIELIEWLDRLGFEEAWFGEHHSGGFEIIGSPELMIAAAAERTKRIRLGTGVISLSYHNPYMVAERIIQLDHMTMGRVMFGAGPGSLIVDAKQLGIDPNKTRDMMVESLEVIIRLFRGEKVTKKTEWFELKDASLQLLPYSHPYPEIAVASSKTPSGGKLAGKLGVGLLCLTASSNDTFDVLASNWQLANEAAAENGHTMDRGKLRLVAPIHIAETREQAYENVKFGLEKWLDYGWANVPRTRDAAKGMSPVESVIKLRGAVVGTPDDAIALVERLLEQQGEFGCFLQMAHNWADWEATKKSYELYARYVVPHIRKSNVNRAASLQMFKDNENMIKNAQATAINTMFDRHNAEREAKGKAKLVHS